MNSEGWSVARFWNVDVLNDIAPVLETIVAILDGQLVDEVRSYDFNFMPERCR